VSLSRTHTHTLFLSLPNAHVAHVCVYHQSDTYEGCVCVCVCVCRSYERYIEIASNMCLSLENTHTLSFPLFQTRMWLSCVYTIKVIHMKDVCVCVCVSHMNDTSKSLLICVSLSNTHTHSLSLSPKRTCSRIQATEWRRCIGCLKLQVMFRKRATNYRALLRK